MTRALVVALFIAGLAFFLARAAVTESVAVLTDQTTNTANLFSAAASWGTSDLVADAAVHQTNPTVNYGGSPLRTDGSPIINSYLRFDVQGYGTVSAATLRIFAETDNSIGFDVRGVGDNTWDELSITYDNAPPFGASVGSSGAVTGGNWYSVDVSSLVTGNGLVSFALTSTSVTATRYSSREGTNPAEVIITE